MTSTHDTPNLASDQEFLDWIFDRAVEQFEEGVNANVDQMLVGREHLRASVQELLKLAQGVAVGSGGAPVRGTLPEVQGFTVLRELGRGGMGAVYLARQDRLGGRLVALKVLPASAMLSPRARQRFRTEAHAIAKLRHDHIVAVHDIVQDEDSHAFAMEWVDGASLARVIDALAQSLTATAGTTSQDDSRMNSLRSLLASPEGSFAGVTWPAYVVSMGAKLARALEAVHGAGLLHRDVKPSNILIRRDGTPLLSDFGLARETDATVTNVGAFAGTAAYAAPEQLRGEENLDHRADIYSLGATLYHALALRAPYAGQTATHILKQIEGSGAPPLRKVNRKLPQDLQTVIATAMDADPARRYQTAADFADDLQRLLNLQPIRARPAGAATRIIKMARRNRRTLVGATIGGGLALILATLLTVYVFIVPRWVEAHVREAHLAMLSPQHTDAMFSSNLWNVPMSQRKYEAFSAGGEEVLAAVVARLDAALRWRPWDTDLRRERDVARLARTIAINTQAARSAATLPGPGWSLGDWDWVDSLPQTTRYARRWRDGQAMAFPDDEVIAAASVEDLRLLGLLAFLCGDVDTAVQAWSRLDLLRDPDSLVEAALGQLYIARGEPTRAYPRLHSAVQAFGDVDFLIAYLAEAALAAGDVDKAGQLLERARALDVDKSLGALPRIHGQWLAATGRHQEADAAFAAPSLAANPVARFHHAMLVRSRGKTEDALRMFVELSYGMPQSTRVATALMAEADQWWAGLTVDQRAKAMVSTLYQPRIDELNFLNLLRRYLVSVELTRRAGGVGGVGEGPNDGDTPPERRPRIAIRGRPHAEGSLHAGNSPFSAPLPGENSSAYLQRASLFDIAHQMEVSDMKLWNRIVKYPAVLKALQVMAWTSPNPLAVSRWLSKFASAAAIAVISAANVNIALAGGPCGTAPCFHGLGDLPGGETRSVARGISADGSTVIGESRSALSGVNDEAFRWTAATGMVGLGDLAGGTYLSYAGGVSEDGGRIAISSGSGNANCLDKLEAGVWSDSDGLAALGDIPGGCFYSIGTDISNDGSLICGAAASAGSQYRASYWTPGTGWIGVGPGDSGTASSFGRVSANGLVMGGSHSPNPSHFEMLRYSLGGGYLLLGDLPGGPVASATLGMSADGSIQVGYGTSSVGREPVRWTQSTGMVALQDLPGGTSFGYAWDVSVDNSLIVGEASSGSGNEAVMWDENLNVQRIINVLAAHGVTIPSGWTLTAATGIAINCEEITIVGNAINPNGQTEGWIARYSIDSGCAGDVNNDFAVNIDDLLGVINSWGTCAQACCLADIAGVSGPDGNVNIDDLLGVINSWGACK